MGKELKLGAIRESLSSEDQPSLMKGMDEAKKVVAPSKRRSVGRPKKIEKFSERVTFLLTPKQMEVLDKKRCKGKDREMEIGKFIRRCLEDTGVFDTSLGRPSDDPYQNVPTRRDMYKIEENKKALRKAEEVYRQSDEETNPFVQR